MIFNHDFGVPSTPDAVFELLTDLDRVATCVPGATLLGTTADGSREGRVDVKFGPMGFSYSGTVKLISADKTARRAVLKAGGGETSGSGTASATVTLDVRAAGKGSKVDVTTDLEMNGGAAQMGAGFIDDAAEELLIDFTAKLTALLGGGSAPMTDAPPSAPDKTRASAVAPAGRPGPSPAAAPVAAPAAPAAFDAGGMAGRIMKRRLKRLQKNVKQKFTRKPQSAPAREAAAPVANDYDLVVVGTGSGALAAAITAHDAGLRVVIYEKASKVGGGTAYSGGVVWAPMNHVMKRKKIHDSIEDATTYLRLSSGGRGNDALQLRYVENVGRVIEQVVDWSGIAWVIWTGQPDYYPDLPGARLSGRAILPHPSAASDVLTPLQETMPELALVRPTPHMDFVPGFQTDGGVSPRDAWLAGRSIIGGLWKAVVERGIEFHVSTPVVDLIREDDRVVGVEIAPRGAPKRRLRAEAVLLNTGGFDWNEELAARYLPGPISYPQTPPSNTGDGHLMAFRAGAGTALMDKAVWHPSIRIPGDLHEEGQQLYRMFNMELSKPHSIVVNAAGKRFATEAAYYAVADAWGHIDTLSRTYPNMPSYFICDQQYFAKYGLPGLAVGDDIPAWISVSDTLEGLAEKLEVDPAAFAEQVERYNGYTTDGVDPEFKRGETAYEAYWGDPNHDGPNPTMGAVSEAPFYGFPISFSHAGTRGGVTTSPDGQALRADGSVIEGLYVSGNTAANQLFGAGYGSGSAVGSSLVFGVLAAEHVVSNHTA
jgi:succinate dehydrogenase/fumarate reductase flavoprotein subunit/carbon monoxide dehydrogenase subunit G